MLTSNQRDILAGILTYAYVRKKDIFTMREILDYYEERRDKISKICEALGKEQEDAEKNDSHNR